MRIQRFIEAAIEGGWKSNRVPNMKHTKDTAKAVLVAMGWEHILLDPLTWQAVGRVEGWEAKEPAPNEYTSFIQGISTPRWKYEMHCMIDALAEGKSIEQYLETL